MTRLPLLEEGLTRSVIGAFFEVYNNLGFGFLEHVYVMALERQLLERGHRVAREVSMHVSYKEHIIAVQRVDMIVDGRLVVETKSGVEIPKAAQRQLFNYLRRQDSKSGCSCILGWDRGSIVSFAAMSDEGSARIRRNPPHPRPPLNLGCQDCRRLITR